MGKTGQKYKQKGYSPNHPIVIIPGLCSSAMKVVESPHKEWIDRRIWLDITTIGFGKVWDQMSLKKKKKKKKLDDKEKDSPIISKETRIISKDSPFADSFQDIDAVNVITKEEEKTKRKWIAHIVLQEDGVTDPEGIKLRPIETIHGIMYLDPGALTNALSYVFGPLIETLWDIGYDDNNLRAAPYDWRIPPCFLESRDGYFLKLKEKVEDMYNVNDKKKVVIIGHSLGTRCSHYFLRYCDRNFGREWISEHIHTWIPVGPLFLGAPKSVRATVTGERMGLEAFLFEDEGILLSRGCGSSAWMFPYVVPDYDFEDYWYKKNNAGFWESHSIEEACVESNVKNIWDGYRHNYHNDPCFGSQEDQLVAPPVDKLFAIYGINLKTEIFYFFKDAPPGSLTKLCLDPTGEMDNYVCSGGIAYETKNTNQNKLRGKKRGGDGTVPYASLSYCSHWAKEIDVSIEELEGAEHREILKDKTFTRLIVEYNCHAPPPPELPASFKNLVYEILEIRGNRKAQRKITLTRKGIKVENKGNNTLYHKKYSSIKTVNENNNHTFSIQFGRSSTVYHYYSLRNREIVQELNVRIKFIDYARPSADEKIDEQGQTELHRAVKDNDIALVRELISDDRNINAQDNHGWTPLHIAAHDNLTDIVLLLLKQPKIEVDLKTKDLTIPLTYALRSPDEDSETVWEAFLDAGANLNCGGGTQDNTPLHEAIIRKNIRAVKWLIKEYANVNAKNNKGNTPLHFAVQHNDKELIAILVENGADRHMQNFEQKTPLNHAQSISLELLTFLRDYKVTGYRARAEFKYEAETPKELSFPFGVRINNIIIKNDYGDGWWYGEYNGLEGYFPSNYVKVSEEIRDESRPPLGAPEPEDGAKDTRDEYGQTPLHRAAFEDKCDVVFQLLMDDSVNVNAQDRNGWTPVHCAANKGSLEVLLVLLQKPNLDLLKRNTDGTPAFHYVARIKPQSELEEKKLAQILDIFINTIDIDILGKGGETALHQAASRGNAFVVKYLLEHDANPNGLNDSGAGPLFFAVANRDLKNVKLLLQYNANPTHKGKRGSPMDVAKTNDSSTILQMLEENKPTDSAAVQQVVKPPIPARKNEPQRRVKQPFNTRPIITKAGSLEDVSESILEKQFSEDDFEQIGEGELFTFDDNKSNIGDIVNTAFNGNLKEFETDACIYILDTLYQGDKNLMLSSISKIIGASPMQQQNKPSAFITTSPSNSKQKQTGLLGTSRPQTATETAGSLLANRKKKKFFGKKSNK